MHSLSDCVSASTTTAFIVISREGEKKEKGKTVENVQLSKKT